MNEHPIKTYLDRTGESISALAVRAKVPRTSIQHVLDQRRHRLEPENCVRLASASKGAISLLDLLTWRWPALKKPQTRRARRTH